MKDNQKKIESWLNENYKLFNECMDRIRQENPTKWAELYCRAAKMSPYYADEPGKHRWRHLLIRLLSFRVYFRLYRLLHRSCRDTTGG